MYSIDLNCDLGEGTGNDSFIMPFISSCSIACGGHFGNKRTIKEAIELAEKYNVMYFDITEISRKAENDTSLLAEDKLHPSKKMYKMWVDKLKHELLDSLKKS